MKQKTNWWIDLVLYAGFIVAFFLDLTGVELHQWIGVFCGCLAIYHLLIHRDWISVVGQRFLGSLLGRTRLYFVVDALLLLGFVLIVGTGLVISTWFTLSIDSYAFWLNVHILVSINILLILLVKLVLHWRWLARVAQDTWLRFVSSGTSPLQQPAKASPGHMGRREFLQVVGVVSVSSFLALLSASQNFADGITSDNVDPNVDSTSQESRMSSGIRRSNSYRLSSSSGSNCAVRCGKSCSFPGHCHRYVDSNNNNLCDLGECL